jgi:hypothetical protein
VGAGVAARDRDEKGERDEKAVALVKVDRVKADRVEADRVEVDVGRGRAARDAEIRRRARRARRLSRPDRPRRRPGVVLRASSVPGSYGGPRTLDHRTD